MPPENYHSLLWSIIGPPVVGLGLLLVTGLVLLVAVRRRLMRPSAYWLLAGEGIAVSVIVGWIFLSDHQPPPPDFSSRPAEPAQTLAEAAAARGFFLGTITDANGAMEDPVQAVVPRDFNSVTITNHLKWALTLRDGALRDYDFSIADRQVDDALQRGARVRGHVLVWGHLEVPAALVQQVATAEDPAATLTAEMRHHVTTMMKHFEGRIRNWDVVNEPMDYFAPELHRSVFFETLGTRFIDVAFAAAREADPDAQLFLNEQFWSYRGERAMRFLALLEELVDRGVPIDGVGIQAHAFIEPYPAPAELRDFIDQIASFGLVCELTELDVSLRAFRREPDPWRAQADYYEAVTRVARQHPACGGITIWGVSDGDTWYDVAFPFRYLKPNAPLLFDAQMRRKPAYDGVLRGLTEDRD